MTQSMANYSVKYQNGNSLENENDLFSICELCNNNFTEPVILPCLHIFDRSCINSLGNVIRNFNEVKCPKCLYTTCLSSIKSLNNNIINKMLNSDESIDMDSKCILCTTGDIGTYKCPDCAGVICERCRNLHKEVVIFQSHTNIQELTMRERERIGDVVKFLADNKPVQCSIHKDVNLDSLCIKCCVALCSKCAIIDHKSHEIVPLTDLFENVNDEINTLSAKCKLTQARINEVVDELNNSLSEVEKSRDINKKKIEDVAEVWKSAIDKMKEEYLATNKSLHENMEYQIMSQINDSHKNTNHIDDAMKWVECYLKKCSILEASTLIKPTTECLTVLSGLKVDNAQCATSLPFNVPDSLFIRNCVRNNFGNFPSMAIYDNSISSCDYPDNNIYSETNYRSPDRSLIHMASSGNSEGMGVYSPVTVSFEEQELMLNKENSSFSSKLSHLSQSCNGRMNVNQNSVGLENIKHPNNLPLSLLQQSSNDFFSFSSDLSPLMNSKGSITASTDSGQFLQSSLYDDNTLTSPILPLLTSDFQLEGSPSMNPNFNNGTFRHMMNLNIAPKPPFPSRSRSYVPMVIKERWGSQGANRGQLNSPHGFCLGFNEEIVVADTQNHRIQIFSKDGQFVSQYGIAGREEGHLWHPRKVTIIRNTQHYVVCDRGNERSRMQIFAKNGYFIRKIAIPYIDIVAGLAINSMGHIVAVDSVSPTIFVVTELGEMVKWIECSSQMREPSDIVVHGENYYICDFKGHCVCVYKQDGTFLFRFGNEKITNYPNGIDVSNHGDVLVGDSHGNRFHVAVFTKDGHLTGEFECPSVKVSRACGLKITSEGYLVTLAKNNHNVLVIDTLYVT